MVTTARVVADVVFRQPKEGRECGADVMMRASKPERFADDEAEDHVKVLGVGEWYQEGWPRVPGNCAWEIMSGPI